MISWGGIGRKHVHIFSFENCPGLTMIFHTERMLALVVLLLVGSQEASAKGKMRLGGNALRHGSTSLDNILSREQLRSCLALEQGLEANSKKIDAQQTDLEANLKKIQGMKQGVLENELRVDRYSQDSVDQHNRMVDELRTVLDSYNNDVTDYEARVKSHNSVIDNFTKSCEGRSYREEDMKALAD